MPGRIEKTGSRKASALHCLALCDRQCRWLHGQNRVAIHLQTISQRIKPSTGRDHESSKRTDWLERKIFSKLSGFVINYWVKSIRLSVPTIQFVSIGSM